MNFFNKKIHTRLINFVFKYKVTFLTLSIIFIFMRLLYLNLNHLKVDSKQLTKYAGEISEKQLDYQCCIRTKNPFRTNIYFVKNHKTGGTTVLNVILKFALLNSLDVLCVDYFAYNRSLSLLSMNFETITPNNKYHIFAQHLRYDPMLKSYQYPNTSMVTLLRHPAAVFQSSYAYFKMENWTHMSLEQFLKSPVKPSQLHGIGSTVVYHGYNQMSVDLGFDLRFSEDDTAIAEFIAKIDREFDFVMIAEYMEASFVLLANLMGWPLEYVAHLNLNVRPSESNTYKLTEQDGIILMDLNRVDTWLYYYFVGKFRKCLQRYGEDDMRRAIDRLRMFNERLKEKCVADEFVGGLYFGELKAVEYIPKNQSNLECVYSMQLNPPLWVTAQNIQAERLRKSRSN